MVLGAMLSFLTIGDLHLDRLASIFTNHLELQFGLIEQAIQFAISKQIKHVFFLGDIANSPKLSLEASLHLLRFLVKYDKQLNLHFILGNHDYNRIGVHSLVLFEYLSKCMFQTVVIHSQPDSMGRVNFLPFPHHLALSEGSINIAHIERNGAQMDNGFTITNGIDPDGNWWISGHLHTKQKIGKTWYPGTLYPLSVMEKGPKGFAYFWFNGELHAKWHKVETFKLPERKIIQRERERPIVELNLIDLKGFLLMHNYSPKIVRRALEIVDEYHAERACK